jgi:hypothetical protein
MPWHPAAPFPQPKTPVFHIHTVGPAFAGTTPQLVSQKRPRTFDLGEARLQLACKRLSALIKDTQIGIIDEEFMASLARDFLYDAKRLKRRKRTQDRRQRN